MGFTEMEGFALDKETKKWVISGIALRSPLKPIFTKKDQNDDDVGEEEDEYCTTPTSQESRIPSRIACPPAPKKRKASSRSCNNFIAVREFFNPPDLETVFIRRAEKA